MMVGTLRFAHPTVEGCTELGVGWVAGCGGSCINLEWMAPFKSLIEVADYMVKIVLHNQSQMPDVVKVVLDLAAGTCLVDNQKPMDIADFKTLNFSHVLLTHPVLELADDVYCYTYDDFSGLVQSAQYVYATLIQAPNPTTCRFKIAPSAQFIRLKEPYKIPVSLHYGKKAKECVDISQLNRIISLRSKVPFFYQDTLLIDQCFSFKDLPAEINDHDLFQTTTDIDWIINQPDDFKKYELRYINSQIGFGVYARESIKKDEAALIYTGIKIISDPDTRGYYFGPFEDSLHMGIDAKPYGNIARFINHAPLSDPRNKDKSKLLFLEANMRIVKLLLNGTQVIVYQALRDLEKNEQILVDYGSQYFLKTQPYLFHPRGYPMFPDYKIMKDTFNKRIPLLQIMFQQGFKGAFFPLYKRPLCAFVLFGLFCFYLNYM
ncbi:MAG: SET domain-containing protein-lysine N-methyltransferase, partial [Legionellales bacterium]